MFPFRCRISCRMTRPVSFGTTVRWPLPDVMKTSFGQFSIHPSPFQSAKYLNNQYLLFYNEKHFSIKFQLNKFRQLRNKEGEPMKDNYRPLQELRGRLVTYRPSQSSLVFDDSIVFQPWSDIFRWISRLHRLGFSLFSLFISFKSTK